MAALPAALGDPGHERVDQLGADRTTGAVRMSWTSSMDGRASSMPKPRPASDLPVDAGVQIGEAVGELDLLAVDGDRAEGGLPLRAGRLRAGRVFSTERNQRTSARSSRAYPARARLGAGAAPISCTGPKIQVSMSKKWTPMLVAMPPDLSSSPFQESKYQRPREVM